MKVYLVVGLVLVVSMLLIFIVMVCAGLLVTAIKHNGKFYAISKSGNIEFNSFSEFLKYEVKIILIAGILIVVVASIALFYEKLGYDVNPKRFK